MSEPSSGDKFAALLKPNMTQEDIAQARLKALQLMTPEEAEAYLAGRLVIFPTKADGKRRQAQLKRSEEEFYETLERSLTYLAALEGEIWEPPESEMSPFQQSEPTPAPESTDQQKAKRKRYQKRTPVPLTDLDPPRWVKVWEVAQHYGMDETTVRNWCRDGEEFEKEKVKRIGGREWLIWSTELT